MSNNISYKDNTLVITRLFTAQPEAVFDAWIKTSKVELWWGCGQANKVTSKIEPKIGGSYHHLMTLKDAGDYKLYGIITEYNPPTLLAYEFIEPQSNQKMFVRVEFVNQGQNTLVHLTQNNLVDEHSEFVKAGWLSAFNGLAHFLETNNSPRGHFIAH